MALSSGTRGFHQVCPHYSTRCRMCRWHRAPVDGTDDCRKSRLLEVVMIEPRLPRPRACGETFTILDLPFCGPPAK